MSHKVMTLVCSRIVGSPALKAVLVNMADKASDGGEGVFASKATIAAETELGVSTVRRVVAELLAKGLIRETGKRRHTNGHTVIYDMDLAAISNLPEWKPKRGEPLPERDPSRSETPPTVTPLPEREVTPPAARGDTSQSETQTILKPPLNLGGGGSAGEASPSLREQALAAMGLGPEGVTPAGRFLGGQGDMAELGRWLALPGITPEAMLDELCRVTAAKADGPPKSFKYYTPAMQRLSADLTAPPLQPAPFSTPNTPARGDRRNDRLAAERELARIPDRIRSGEVYIDTRPISPW